MNILSINNLSKMGREKPLFTQVSFGIQEGEKAALIGRNGTGKSTLLNTIAGILQPDEGTVTINKTSGLSFLPQNPQFNPTDTIRDHIFKSSSPKLKVINTYLHTCQQISEHNNQAPIQEKLQAQLALLTQQMDNQNLWNYESQISSILNTLGIIDLNRQMNQLSGGMVKKVALAQVLVEDSQLLLLDEPTNHLDITTITWLQDYLKETKRSVLMVTHDRYFLDAVCTNIYELDRNRIKLYLGNYSKYLEKKETEAQIEQNSERRIEAILRFERNWLLRGPCARGTKAKARIQRDMQLINREKFTSDKGFTFQVQGKRLGGKVLELKNISKNFPKGFKTKNSSSVIRQFNYTFTKGQKIGIFGNNGSGKSTLLNIITQQIQPDTGIIDVGVNTKFGYYTQNIDFPIPNLTVLEYIKETAEQITLNNGKTVSVPKFLEEFGFEGKIQYSPVSTLSGGERKRLFLVRLLLQNPNFLILDEPTNDFDIFTMNILEDFLMQYQGCLLLVSHDRYFMDKVTDSLFIMEDDGYISGFAGKCSEYIEYIQEQEKKSTEERLSQQERDLKKNSTMTKNEQTSPNSEDNLHNATRTNPTTKKKLSYKEQKEFENLDQQIPILEQEKLQLEKQMSSSDYEQIQKASKRYNELTSQLEQMYSRWEELSEFI